MTKITKDGNCLYLTEEIVSNNIYERSKQIVNFCDKEIKLFEKEIDRAICEILERNGIRIGSTKKSVLKSAFAMLKQKGKSIKVEDIYRYTIDLYNSTLIWQNDLFTVWLEDDTHLQCGVSIQEIQLHGRFEL